MLHIVCKPAFTFSEQNSTGACQYKPHSQGFMIGFQEVARLFWVVAMTHV